MFLIVQPTTMELTKNSLDFITNHFGYTPERMTMNNPDGTQSTAYLVPSREGMVPWSAEKIEVYVQWMQSPNKVELLKQVMEAV